MIILRDYLLPVYYFRAITPLYPSVNLGRSPRFVFILHISQFHDGVGFLTSHLLLTNIFERSLQLVNPKLSLPYWDFTIEASSSSETKYDPSDPTSRTPLLDPSWFGTFDPNDQMVSALRWW